MSLTPWRSRRVTRLAGLSTIVAALVVALLAPASAQAAPGNDQALLRTYQPVLVFHPQEQFRPTKVQGFVADAQLERFVGTDPATQLVDDDYWTVVDPDPEPGELPPPALGVFHRLNHAACIASAPLAGVSCYAAAAAEGGGGNAVYGRVVRTPTRIVLQYWLFYVHNPLILPPTPVGLFWQSHEGDWEVVNVVLNASGAPVEAAYSQHCTGERKQWADVEKRGTHPVAYVALGSHANFFAPGSGALGAVPLTCVPAAVQAIAAGLPFPLPLVDQVLGGGSELGPPGRGYEPATIHRIEGTAWSVFGGRWGESEYFYTPIALPPLVPQPMAVPFGLAPLSPALQRNWDVATILAWPGS
jgi:hypothetical protein